MKASRVLEITIISGEALSLAGKRSIKKNTYVTIETETSCNNQFETSMDHENGSYPSWNEKFMVEIPMHAKYFTLKVLCKNGFGDQVVGTVNVPVSDFIGRFFPSNYLHFLSYRLRDQYGSRNGIINFSVRVKSSSADNGGVGCSSTETCSSSSEIGWTYGGSKIGQGASHGVVIGIPVGNRY
ncbi:BON1-associated protein 1-like [Rutidosis leptorrhynchoides]|uniref:BON1-associated protein 1-like n=1 Tax=Rutidosis leptorrhynchoides TaxID=125765 RepID=UPI003A9913AC